LIKATDPLDLSNQVIDALKQGYDLYTPLFVSEEGLLCQFMIPMLNIYKYKLISAKDLDDLELQANNLIALGFDFLYNTVMWRGFYLQWMSCMNETGATIREAVASLKADQAAEAFIAANREDETDLVAGVRSELGLGKTVEYGAPFPVQQDAVRIGTSILRSLHMDIPERMVVGGVVIS